MSDDHIKGLVTRDLQGIIRQGSGVLLVIGVSGIIGVNHAGFPYKSVEGMPEGLAPLNKYRYDSKCKELIDEKLKI
jgi:hypothetical protein